MPSSLQRLARRLSRPGMITTSGRRLAALSASTEGWHRRIHGLASPCSTAEVCELVRAARASGIRLYAVSQGANWGFGSALPNQHDCLLVDLSNMRRIRNLRAISPANPVAVLEPGVTQAQLDAVCRRRGMAFNATASGLSTSVLGNCLDRGFGWFGLRADDISGLEVVLGNGEVIHTGYGHYPHAAATHVYRHGLGPWLDGLFTQSPFGIVTAAGFQLLPEPPTHLALLTIADSRLPAAMDTVAALKRSGAFTANVRIGNSNRAASISRGWCRHALAEASPEIARAALALLEQPSADSPWRQHSSWTGLAPITGSARMVRARISDIREAFAAHGPHVRARFIEAFPRQPLPPPPASARSPRQALDRALAGLEQRLMRMACGVPDNAALSAAYAHLDAGPARLEDLTLSRAGVLFCNPALPLTGAWAARVARIARQSFALAGTPDYLTFSAITPTLCIAVINAYFDRADPADVERAHRAIDRLRHGLAKIGIFPYRLDLRATPEFASPSPPYRRLVSRLQTACDPDGVLAPGRYAQDAEASLAADWFDSRA